jgi:hypothetical protein
VRLSEPLCVAIVSLFGIWLFFFEYIPPTKQVHLWSDIEGYHYPLLNYAGKSVLNGRLPLWDPSMYCGLPFAGNIQAGLFYPPNWLLFASSANLPKRLRGPDLRGDDFRGQHGMRFTAVEILAFLHVWLAFLFTFLWLRERTSVALPAILGGIGVACGGYLLSQMNHLGVSCGYAWMPFALWGIEQTSQRREWRYMWKVAVASAMCLLAGYPPTWLAFLIIVFAYAIAVPGRSRTVPLLAAAILLSLAISAIQLLPAYEATSMKTPESSFGAALPFGKGLYIALAVPNYFDYNRTNNGPEAVEVDYLYLGVPALFALAWLLRRGWFAGAGVALAIVGIAMFVAGDPTGFVLRIVEHLPVAPDVLRRYNLIAALPLAGALLTASAVSDFLSGTRRAVRTAGLTLIWMGATIAWSIYLLWLWPPGGPDFTTGIGSILYPAVLLTLFTTGLWLYRINRQNVIYAVLLLAIFVDFKAFGTNRRFNAVTGNADVFSRGDARLGGHQMGGVEDAVYLEMLANPGYRVGLYEGPHATDIRLYGLSTPQGFDPFLTDQFKKSVESFHAFRTNRLFDIDPTNEVMLQHFGVRWIFVREDTAMERTLLNDSRFQRLGTGDSFYTIFEYLQARPAWRFSGAVTMTQWEPEHRAFRVNSDTGGAFILVEQFFPGWKVLIDGRSSNIERTEGTLQSVQVPTGEHTVEFRYDPLSLKAGAAISLLGVLGTLLVAMRT